MKKCKHKHIIITRKSRYNIPQGWNKLMEQEDSDLADYFINEDETAIFCEDCGEYLNEWI